MIGVVRDDEILSDLMRAAQQLHLDEADIDTILARLDAIGGPVRRTRAWEDLPLPGVSPSVAPHR